MKEVVLLKPIFSSFGDRLILSDDEFVKLWRSVSVDGVDEAKIEEYLAKQGIASMQDQGIKRVIPKRKKGVGVRRKTAPKDNQHMLGVLEDYSEGGLTASKADR